ncbi:hypothetical protein AB0395_03135 [Streptosporangium sp. NPDC051023]|uniref:hypothetical protein n=1 Tax=Streptosporangium sp. NPDC051023 TaxID=3155410 RepID=UPI00344F9C97
MLIGPPGRVLLPVTALAALLLLYGDSVPGGYFMTSILGVLLALGVAVVWTPRFLVGLFRADGRPGLYRHWPRWAVVPLAGVAVVALLSFPRHAGWCRRRGYARSRLPVAGHDVVVGGGHG